MTTRRNVLRSIPAAIALAVLPSRLTRNVAAQDASLTVEAEPYTSLTVANKSWGENRWVGDSLNPKPFGMFVPTKADQERDIIAYVDRCCEIDEWVGGRSYMMHSDGDDPRPWDPGYDHIVVPSPDGEIHALPGDLIVKSGDRFYVVRG